jgi:hypothetical protein
MRQTHYFLTIGSLAHNMKVGLPFQQFAGAGAHHSMIVG